MADPVPGNLYLCKRYGDVWECTNILSYTNPGDVGVTRISRPNDSEPMAVCDGRDFWELFEALPFRRMEEGV